MNIIIRVLTVSTVLTITACARHGVYRHYEGPVVVETGRTLNYVVERPYPVYRLPQPPVVGVIDYGPVYYYERETFRERPAPKVYRKPRFKSRDYERIRLGPMSETQRENGARGSWRPDRPMKYKAKDESEGLPSFGRREDRAARATRSDQYSAGFNNDERQAGERGNRNGRSSGFTRQRAVTDTRQWAPAHNSVDEDDGSADFGRPEANDFEAVPASE